jgi:hypothetical protein
MNLKHGDLIRVKEYSELEKMSIGIDSKKGLIFEDTPLKFYPEMKMMCGKEFYVAKTHRKGITSFSVYSYDYMHVDRFELSPVMVDLMEDK